MAMHAWAVLQVQDLSTSIAFYTERLGWTAGEQPAEDLAYILDPDNDAILLAGPKAEDMTPYLAERALIKQPGDTLRLVSAEVDAQRVDLIQRGLSDMKIVETAWRDRELRVHAPDKYTISFITPAHLSPDEALELYAQAPDDLDAALAGLSPQELDRGRESGGWTIRQIVHHIADGDDLWAMMIKAALAAPGCSYQHDWYNTDNTSAVALDYAGRAIEPAHALFRAHRVHIVQLIRHLPNAWDQYVMFKRAEAPEAQKVTVGFIVGIQARHALEHIQEIREMRELYER